MTAAIQPGAIRAGVLGTTVAHGALIVAALVAVRRATVRPSIVYEVNLVAAPLPAPAVHNVAPAATPAAPATDLAPPVKPKPVKSKPVPKPPAKAQRVDQTPVTKSAATPAPGEKPSTGQDVVTLHQEGISFPYPAYLRNIEDQIFKRWNNAMFRPGYDAKIAFVILKDGSVVASSIETVKGSGSMQYDLNASSAIESAGAQHAFGPLPDGFNGPSLPILFDFTQVARRNP